WQSHNGFNQVVFQQPAADFRFARTRTAVKQWLHPAKAENSKNDYISLNGIDMLKKDSNQVNNYFYSIYSTCTNMKKDEISSMLYSEINFAYIYAEQVRNISLANKIEPEIKTMQILHYIKSDDNNK
ncbi:hypothetical protein AXA91_26905, partial [Salmonella enterica]|nr:hypothetical protein [Salmonella enterica]